MKYFIMALSGTILFSLYGCEDPAPVNEKEEEMIYTNTYEYDGESFDIQSVVKYETETTVELWLSPVKDLNTIGSVIENGNYGVVSVNRTYIGGRDLFKKSGSYVRFNEKMFEKGCNAKAFVDMSFEDEAVCLSFRIETLYSDGKAEDKEFSGNYKGAFTDHNQVLVNQWSYNRIVKAITGGKVNVTMDDNYNTTMTFCLYDDPTFMHEAVTVTIPESKEGEEIVESDDVQALTYDNGKTFELKNSANINKLIASLVDDNVTLEMDLANGSDFLAANYTGKVEINESKPNHIACTVLEKNSEGDYEEVITRRNKIHKLFIKSGSNSTSFYFGMSENAESAYREAYPTLMIETDLMDGTYHFGGEAVGRFKYSDDHTTISEQPFYEGTLYVNRTDNTYKIILRIRNLLISGSKVADIEVFYEGRVN